MTVCKTVSLKPLCIPEEAFLCQSLKTSLWMFIRLALIGQLSFANERMNKGEYVYKTFYIIAVDAKTLTPTMALDNYNW